MRKYQKLVRDKIPGIIRANGEIPTVRVLSDDDFDRALRVKVAEEAYELIEAHTRNEICLEIADLEEVLDALKAVHNLSNRDVRKERRRRRWERGGFDKKLFLDSVEGRQ